MRLNNRLRWHLSRDHRVLLYNDSRHSFEDVAQQLTEAAGCDIQLAMHLAGEVHRNGKAAVYCGPPDDCRVVVKRLREIDLQAEMDDPHEEGTEPLSSD